MNTLKTGILPILYILSFILIVISARLKKWTNSVFILLALVFGLSMSFAAQADPVWQTGTGNQTSNSGTSGNTQTVSKPANIQAGDLIIVTLHYERTNLTINSSNGFTLIRREALATTDGTASRATVAAFYKIATASEPATYTFTSSGNATSPANWRIMANRVTGHNPIQPIGNQSGNNAGTATTGTSRAITGINTTSHNALLVSAMSMASGDISTLNVPTGMTQAFSSITRTAAGVAYQTIATPGATGNKTWSWTTGRNNAGLLFAINNNLDYGDAPDTATGTASGNYQTLATDNGPRHAIIPNLMIGSQVDADNGTLQNSTATSDDTTNSPDDEDGLVNPPIMPTTAGQTYSLPVYVKNETNIKSYLTAYIDFNRDGDFVDAGEKADTQYVYWNGYFYPTFTLPSGLTAGTLYTRLRLSQTLSEADVPTGAATSGEVEDHTLTVSSGTLYDFGDAPASYGNARHTINNSIHLGINRPDAEAASQYSYNARFGDGADEDGVPSQSGNTSIPLFPILKMTASSYSVDLNVTNTTASPANLRGWIDFDQNGLFDTDEAATVSVPTSTSNGTATLTWNSIPTDIKLGTTFIRLRLTTDATVTASTPSNNASNGEVEDYPIAVAIDVPPDSADVTLVKGETPACSSTVFTDNFNDVPADQYFGANTSATPYVIRDWTATGGGSDSYARTLTTALFPTQGTSIYFGNGFIRRFYPDVGIAPQFDGNGRMLSPPDAIELRDNVDDTTPGINTNQADWGPEPVKLSRTFATTAGQRYRLYFSAIPEDAGNDYYASGLMRVDTPSGSVHFKAPGGMEGIQKYRIEFTATGTSSTISFINYGHLGTDGGYCDPNSVISGPWCSVGGIPIDKKGNELIIDDVTVALASACPTSAIAGTVYTDKNGNNTFDSATENGLGNISVSLYDNNGTTTTTTDDLKVATVATAANGSYSFANISAVPRYRIEVDTRDTDLPTSAVIGTTNPLADVAVTAGNTLANQNFGFDLGCDASAGEFGGIVFRDYNQNGIRESQEEGIAGVTVTAYDTANTAVATTTTDARGWYRFSGQTNGAQYRLEFTGLPASLSSGAQGTDSATNVRFVTASSSCSTHYGVSDPVEYCQATPYVSANVFVGGDPTAADVGVYTSVHTFPYNATGPAYAETPPASSKASIAQTGAIWGMAYQKSSKTLYASAVMRRFSGLGSLGTGGIYKINMNDPTTNTGASAYLDVKTIGIDTGADVRLTDSCSPKLSTNPWVAAHDVAAWDAVGKVGIGDIDHDDANNRLWLVNLNDRKLYGINNISPTTTPTAANVLGGYSINLPSPHSCTSGTFRPWAVKYHRGYVYVGGVCDASSAPYTLSNVRGYVLRFDPANTAAGFSYVKDFPIDQQRNLYSHDYPAQWNGWIPQADAVGWPYFHSPIVSNLEFDTDGSIIIGIADRAGMQNGNNSYDEPSCADLGVDYTSSTGDVLRLCKTNSGYATDSEPGCTTDIPSNSKTINEYYWGDMGPTDNSWQGMNEIASGGLAMAPGSATVLMSSYDVNTWGTNGVAWLNNRTGSADNRYYVSATTMGKATGMGELEILCDQAPNEIGNRVWLDTDKDGIQDAGEAGINNVNVTLTCGTDSASTTTNTSGEYYFSNVSGGNATFMGSGESCSLSISSSQASLSGHTLTTQNADSKTDNNYQTDIRDSDAAVSGANAVISFTVGSAGQNNHSLDFGYQTNISMGSISGTVYRDSNQNNSFDSGSESGIASISVSLYDENFTASNTADDTLLSTVSSGADGSYSFSNLNPARSYRIQTDSTDSDLPAGASIGTANPLTGVSVAAGATTGNQNFGFDLLSAGSCAAPAPSGTNAYINTAVGWTHDENDPAGQAANHALPAINKPDEIAAASNQTATGLTTGRIDWGLYATTASVPATLADAISNNKYLQYSFTTQSSLSNTHILYGLGLVTQGTTIGSNHSGKYKIQVQVDDNAAFSSPQVVKTLIQIDEANPTTGASISEGPYDYGVAYYYNHYDFDSPLELASNTTYYVRFYLYDDTVSGFFGGSANRVVFDNLKLKTHECATSTSNDFGDAPATYGDASHTIVAGIHLGDNAPDGETASKYSFNARTDNHDDGAPSQNAPGAYIPLFPVLQLTDTSYSSSFKVTNNTGTAGKLYGWIDFDKSGTFEEDEAASVDVPTGSSNASVTLNWASIPFDVQLGTTAIRLRLTTDSSITTSTPTGAASNGEVEDYPIAIAMDIPPNSPSLAIISGATPAACETVVFQDNFDDLTPTVFWGTNRPGSQAIRDWTRSGGGNDTYAHITTPVGQGSSVYFGNGGIRQISPATPSGYTFDANGKLLTTIDAIALRDDMDDFITPGTTANEYGSKADWGPEPVRLARTFATTPGKTYRLYFKAIPENPAGTYASGIMRLDMPGGSIHFKAPGSAEGTQTYAVEFTAFDYNSTITFVNYGHTEGSNNGYCDPNSVFNANPWCTVGGRDDVKVGNELIIDDVVLTQAACATGTIHGTVYHDANLNNSHDAGIETGITAISVKLYDENGTTGNTADDRLVYTASTYVQGGYYFTDVDTSNTYRIEVNTADPDLPAHMLLGTANPLTGVTVTANTILYNQDFGFDLLTPSNIAGTVYLDNNTNDVFDTGVDYGLGSIKVSLYNDNGTAGNTADDTLLGNTSTAINGAYRFDSLDHTLTYRVAVDTTDTDIPAGATIGTTNPVTGVAVPANTTVTKNFGFDQASNGITGKVFLDYNLNGQLDSNSAMSNFANNTSIKLAFDKGIAGAQIKAECVGASGKLSFGPVTSDVNGQYYLATPGAVAGNYNCVLQMSSIPAGYSVATQSGSGNQVLTQVVSPTAVNTYFALQEETSYCQNNPDMATNRFAYGQQTPNPPFAGNNDVPNIFAFPYNSGTTGLPNTNPPGYNQPLETDAAFRDLALANQVGSVFGLGWHPASDSLFASAYMKAWTGFGSGGTGGIYRVDMSNPASPTTSLYANLNQIFPATPPTAGSDPYLTGVFSAGNPGYVQIADGSGSDPDGSYVASGNATRDNQDGQINDAVGKTAFGDLDVSADGKSLFAVNMANNKLYILPIRTAPLSAADAGLISSYNIPFASNCKTGGTKRTFGLGEYQGGLYVATQCGAEYGLPWEVPEHSVFRFDLGSKTFSTTPSLVYSRPSEDTYSINFSTITDLVFDPAGNMTLTFRETLPSPYGPSVDGGKGTGYSVIRRACVLNKATFTWERENNGSCGGVTTAGKDNGYGTGPSYGTFFHQEYPADHGPSLRSASYGGAAQIPGFMEAAYTIAEPFEFYSVGISWVDTGLGNPATAGQRNRAYSFYKGTGAFEYPDNRPVNGKNAAIGDLEILCDTPSLEIGNRVWQDSDSDGVQDAGEPPVAGVKVELFANGANLASATPLATALTDANGYYAFSSDMRGYPATGNNAPNDTAGANGGFNAADIQGGRASTASHKYGLLSLTPNTQYQVVIRNVGGASKQAALGSMTLTTAAQGTDPELDSDAGVVGDHAVANVSMLGYGNHYHAVDFGFKAGAILPDYGDAPATYGTPSHTIVSGIRLGATAPDGEAAAQPSTGANLDDTTGTDDEDGITLPTLTAGQTATITATVAGAGGYLQGWMDWNGDGDFADTGEQVATNIQDNAGSDTNTTAGTIAFNVAVPAGAVTTQTYARFRWSSTSGLNSTAAASDGEVEDYALSIAAATCLALPVTTVGHATVLANNEFQLTPAVNSQIGAIWGTKRVNLAQPFDYTARAFLGSKDGADGMTFTLQNTSATALGSSGRGLASGDGSGGGGISPSLVVELDTHYNYDDGWNDPLDDHMAIYLHGNGRHNGAATSLISPVVLGELEDNAYHLFRVVWNPATTTLQVYVDGILRATKVVNLVSELGTSTPYWGYTASTGGLNNRHAICNLSDPSISSASYDQSDAPATYGTPSHQILTGFRLGAAVDADTAAMPNVSATGDDTTGVDDEDGVTLPTLTQGQTASITATVAGAGGYLQGWIDWNGDGDFADAGEQVATNIQDNLVGDTNNTAGTIAFNVAVPAGAVTTQTYARFRWSSTSGLNSTAAANDGEVEDYALTIASSMAYGLSGKVFEDVNYGGGAGRPLSTAGAAGVLGVRVELYNSTGSFVSSTTTADGGPYSFANLANGTYYVRVVNDTIRSTRAGSDASERSIQTFRSDGTSAVTNEVGGRKPALVDAAANTTNQTLNTSTFVLSGGGQAQSVQPVTVSGSNITGADFGFNFSTVININDSGQGSLRQAILNANLLANSMTQPGSNYGVNTALNKEVLVFNIPASGDPQGRADICSGTTCNITVNSKLPDITAPLIIDGATQPGYTAGTPGMPRIRIAPTTGLDAIGISIAYTATDSTVRGLSITGFRTSNMNRAINVAAARTVVESNYLGVKPDGTADANSQGIMLEYADTATTVIGGSTAAKRNIISGNLRWGIAYDTGATAGTIQNNFIGTNVAGTAALGNQFGGIDLEGANDTLVLDNVIAGNAGDGLQIGYTNGTILTSGYTIRGNRIGVGINGEAIGNTGPGIMNYGGSSNHQMGGTAAGQANIIANNIGGGIKLAANSAGVNNVISGNSFYANGNLGIDLGNNGVTVNDANDADAGANNLLNFPLIADLSIASGNLTVKGCAPSGATVELFEADVSAGGKAAPGDNKVGKSKDYGEGQTYLASFVEGGASDTDTANCTLATDADGNNQTGMKAFSVTIPAPVAFVAGDTMTATATLAGTGTSEFSPVFLYDATCKLIVTTTADTDSAANNSGSLRDAIECANSTPGVDSITFNMPNTETGFINPDGVANNGNEYWRISLNSQLPSITEGVSIDGRTQTSNKGNTNSGNVAAAATVGTDNIALAVVTAPEIEIVGQWFGAGFDIKASNVSIYGLGMRLFDTDIRMDQANTTGILLNELALGVNPVNGGDPGAGQRSNQHIAVNASGVGFVLTNSLLGFNDNKRGIVTGQYNNVSDVSATISGNHFIGVGMTGNTENAAIEILRTQNPSVTISGNRFVGRGSATATDLAVEFNDYGGGNTTCVTCRVENNTISGFHDGVGYFTDASLTGLVVSKNRIYSNTEFAVFLGNVQNASVTQNYLHDNGKSGVLINKDPAKGNVISQNSIYHNGEVGINLAGGNQVDPGGVTLNDANDADSGPNGLLNMPVINQVIVGASNLTVRGCAPAAAVVELFEADVSPGGAATAGDNTFALSRDYGEGQRYLTSVAENSAADIDAGNCALPAFDGMNNTGMKAFQFTLPLPSGIVVGDKLTATATVAASGTSEFGPVMTSEGPPPNIGGGSCTASGGTDILFIVDNSGSITPAEYADFASTIQTVGTQLLTDNPQNRIGIAHFGGPTDSLVSGGQYVYFERDFSSVAMTAPVRQFGTGGAYNVDWWADHLAGAVQQIRYALDSNASTSSTYIVSPVREMSRNASTPLQIVLMTDAVRYGDWVPSDISMLIDPAGSGAEPDDGSDFTIYNQLKSAGISFSVVSFNPTPADIAASAAIASTGGTYNGSIDANPQDPQGSQTTPRRFISVTSGFQLTAAQVNELVEGTAICTSSISGLVFEDPNYGGLRDAGGVLIPRPASSAGTKGIANATVEIYASNGSFVDSTSTDTNGIYKLPSLTDGKYYVRVVSDSVSSSRAGGNGSELPVQTYPTVGGVKPSVADAGINAGGASSLTVSPSKTFVFTGGTLTGQQAQSVQEITLSGSSINNVDFGFNFSSVVNTNDNGQGSLRQFLLNANLLGDDNALTQEGRSLGKEHAILILPTSDPRYASGVWTILLNTSLPNIDKPMILDGSTQSGFNPATGVPVVKLDGNNLAGNGLSLVAGSTGSSIRSLAITRFGGDGINLQGNTTGNAILGNSIHTNGGLGIDLVGGTENVHGVTANASNDTGPNNLLNYPEFKTMGITDGTKIITYDFDLDVPVGTYRLEFFKNDSADASGHGEGQIYLGGRDIEVSATGKQNYKGSFNANQLLAGNDKVSATLTRKVGADFTDTSEFAGTATGTTTTVCKDWITNPSLAPADFNIAENSSIVAFITAKDASGNTINYALKGADGKYFAITASSPTTPECKTVKMIDPNVIITKSASADGEAGVRAVPPGYLPPPGNFESPADANKDNVYEVQVVATYADGTQVTRDLTVRVLNENEAPVIISAPAVSFVEDSVANVLDITSQDQDAGTSEGNGLSYRISGGTDASFFAVTSTAGILTFRAIPDYDAPMDSNRDNIYEVEVTVTDTGGLSNSKLFTVTVTNNTADDGILLQTRAFLQGAYDGGSQMMAADLNALGLLPAKQPYGLAPFKYTGTETFSDMLKETTGNNAPVDWMLVELRSSLSQVVASRAVIVQRDGDLVDAQTGSPDLHFAKVAAGNYYVVIRHRNHLDVITASPVSLVNTARMVDFTLSATAVKAEHARVTAGKLALMWAGDINGSQTLTASGPGNDANTLLSTILSAAENPQAHTNYVLHGYLPTDINMDGKTLFSGPNNDASLLVGNILLHPLNTGYASNYIVKGGLSP
ncbi:MAG TPA: SdrD B-like domain-containing protein [Candidatus Thiothrix moscowensis]|uniref:SdrD B-like domain-containing protein n=1 Tax=unclassified Thiothrix TaxID=2636184 RepID=UPI0025DFCBC4|nr:MULTISPECIES: SdrD B-like domain-containing protein [unclassified Thiothrix]HRJ52933.1 SdrD B-like domain-containing protein [Candidatus Thiothrix moscowensis]HRJ93023.1 SdrD B-like domain-containing protein [Candidatus Thiothrix moscowensis]